MEANRCLASQFSAVYKTQRGLLQCSQVSTTGHYSEDSEYILHPPTLVIEILFNIILPCMARSDKWSFSFSENDVGEFLHVWILNTSCNVFSKIQGQTLFVWKEL
jgi:hypothetical protein